MTADSSKPRSFILYSVDSWAVFPHNWAVFSLRCENFFAVVGCVCMG